VHWIAIPLRCMATSDRHVMWINGRVGRRGNKTLGLERKPNNPGKREREARKRHRRAWVVESGNVTLVMNHSYFTRYPPGAEAVPLKLGRKHFRRWTRNRLAVADSRKAGGERALESVRRSLPTSI